MPTEQDEPRPIDRLWARLYPWLLVGLALFLHWPSGAGFKADDWFAIRYASDLGNVVHDVAGPQYGIAFLRFWRPCITASFGIDGSLFGTSPFGYYLMNLTAFVAAVLLLWAIVRLLRPDRAGMLVATIACALWICHPFVVTSLRWVAGRVDTHVAPPILFAVWLHLRLRRGGRRWPVWFAAVWALATKESAVGFPLIALSVDFLDPHPSLRPAPALLGRGLPALPYLALIPIYFGFRYAVLGELLGGYGFMAQAGIDPGAILDGLRHNVAATLKPDARGLGSKMAAWLIVAAVAFWILHASRGRGARVLGVLLLGAGLYGPLAQLLPAMRAGDQRFAYLACVSVLATWGFLACAVARQLGPLAVLFGLTPLVWLLPARATQRKTMDGHDAFNSALIARVAEVERELAPGDPVVIGGPAEQPDPAGGRIAATISPYRFLWGLGAFRKPPFTDEPRDAVTLRRLHDLCEPVTHLPVRALPAWVRIDEGGTPRVARASARSRAELVRVDPVGFDGTLRAVDLDRLARFEPLGFPVRGAFGGRVAICTTAGSCVVRPQVEGDVLSLAAVLGANVTHRVGGDPLPALFLVWNAMDLAADSPIFLFWRERDRHVMARFRVTRGFSDAVHDSLRDR